MNPRGSVVELAAALCDIESVSGNEAAIADAVEAQLRSCAHLEVIRDGDAVVAMTRLGRERRVVIAGHIDTVPVNDNLPTRRELRDGVDTLVGRGTVDMKGGVAVQLALAVELVEPAVDVTWVFYDNEEVSGERNGLARARGAGRSAGRASNPGRCVGNSVRPRAGRHALAGRAGVGAARGWHTGFRAGANGFGGAGRDGASHGG